MADKRPIELHFQDDFTGQSIEVRLDGKTVETFVAKTRYQVGLAHVVKLEAAVGASVEIVVEGGARHTLRTVKDVTDYGVRLTQNGLVVEPSRERLNYL